MRQIFYSILLVGAISFVLTACSNGDYIANPSTNANQSINPLNPLTSSQFNWVGISPMSVKINGGALQKMDTAWYYLDTKSGFNYIVGMKGAKKVALRLFDVWGNNMYMLTYKDTATRLVELADSVKIKVGDSTVNTLNIWSTHFGNSGEIKILRNDSATISGMFYCQLADTAGAVTNISEGYFTLPKFQ